MKKSAIAFFLALASLLTVSPALAKTHHSMMPVCKGATVYAVSATKVYYMRGTSQFGHVKGGSYMCQAAANAKGYHGAAGAMMKTPSH